MKLHMNDTDPEYTIGKAGRETFLIDPTVDPLVLGYYSDLMKSEIEDNTGSSVWELHEALLFAGWRVVGWLDGMTTYERYTTPETPHRLIADAFASRNEN